MGLESHFDISYNLFAASESEANRMAEEISIEQSVEMPSKTVPDHLKHHIGKLISVQHVNDRSWLAKIRFPATLIDGDLTQFLNILFGNISLKPRIKVTKVNYDFLNHLFQGPSFGIEGIRNILSVRQRALTCTALKPVGLTPAELAERAYLFTRGGIDIIKDDHNLTNQTTAPFRNRVASVVRAIHKGEQISGKKTLYFPNITTSPVHIEERFHEAIELGADGVLISAQLAGIGAIQNLAQKELLPIMVHPSFSGSYVINQKHGIGMSLYFGTLFRAFGSDCTIFPNSSGRFTYSQADCRAINRACKETSLSMKTTFPVPAGGLNRETVQNVIADLDKDIILLIGGSLYSHPKGLEVAAKEFVQQIDNQT